MKFGFKGQALAKEASPIMKQGGYEIKEGYWS